ncbi:MAG: glycosyltransferase family 2 protein [Vulcanimicrobiota bacterium]
MKLTVVIPNYNDKKHLGVCLKSLEKALDILDYEIIVVDNGSKDGSVEMLKKQFPDVRLIENEKNEYFARACNQGLKYAKGDYVLFLNSDTQVVGDCVLKMIDYMGREMNSDVGAVNCNIYYPDGTRQQAAWRRTNKVKYFFYKYLFLNEWVKKKLAPFYELMEAEMYEYSGLGKEAVDVDMISGCVVLMRTKLARYLKGFDERYRLYCTDEELCLRIRETRNRIVSLPYDKIIHHHFAATGKIPKVFDILNEDIQTFIKDNFGIGAFILGPLYALKAKLAYLYKKNNK